MFYFGELVCTSQMCQYAILSAQAAGCSVQEKHRMCAGRGFGVAPDLYGVGATDWPLFL